VKIQVQLYKWRKKNLYVVEKMNNLLLLVRGQWINEIRILKLFETIGENMR